MDENTDFSAPNTPFVGARTFAAITDETPRFVSVHKTLRLIWESRVLEVRKALTKNLSYADFMDEEFLKDNAPAVADFTEKVIRAMALADGGYNSEPSTELLVWYLKTPVFSVRAPMRAIEFAVELLNDVKKSAFPRYKSVHGAIYGAIKREPEWYWAPSVPEYLEESLAHENWTLVERALELICLAEDTSFFEPVRQLSVAAQQAEEKAEDFKTRNAESRFASAKIRGVLQEAVRHLLICKTEQDETTKGGFEDVVSRYIVMRAGLTGLGIKIKTELRCPSQNDRENFPRGEYLPLELFIECQGGEKETAEFSGILKKLRLSVKEEGAELYEAFPKPGGFPSGQSPHLIFQPVSSHTKILFKPLARKTARVRIELMKFDENADQTPFPGKGMFVPIAKITRYIHRAE